MPISSVGKDMIVSTIREIAYAYGISKAHLMKIVHELGQHGLVETTRGRSGGLRLARPPQRIRIGEVVRLAETDFALVECHEPGREFDCAISPACRLKRGFRRALDAFLRELDQLTLHDAVVAPRATAALRTVKSTSGTGLGIPVSWNIAARYRSSRSKAIP